jgi:spore germination protein KC
MKIAAIVVLLMGICFCMTGCQYRDIDKRLFVLSLGIDVSPAHPDKYLITFKTAVPLGDPKSGEERFELIQIESDSFAEALREVKSKVDKELDYGHCKVVVYGERLAKKDLTYVTDWLMRRRDIQLVCHIAVGRPNAYEVLKVKPKTERIPSNALILELAVKDGTQSPFIATTYLFDFDRRQKEIGLDPFLPVAEAEKSRIKIDKMALLDKKKIVVTLDPQETRLYNLLVNSHLKTNLTCYIDNKPFSINVENSKAAYTITPDGSRYRIDYKLQLSGSLEEVRENSYSPVELLKAVGEAGEKQLNRDVAALLAKLQAYGVDPIGFGARYGQFHFKDNDQFRREWAKMYKEMKFQVKTEVEVKWSGVVK